MDIGIFTRSPNFNQLNSYFNEIIKNKSLYNDLELIEYGNFYLSFIQKNCKNYQNQSQAYLDLDEIRKIKELYQSLAKVKNNSQFLTLSINLGNFMQELHKEYL